MSSFHSFVLHKDPLWGCKEVTFDRHMLAILVLSNNEKKSVIMAAIIYMANQENKFPLYFLTNSKNDFPQKVEALRFSVEGL